MRTDPQSHQAVNLSIPEVFEGLEQKIVVQVFHLKEGEGVPPHEHKYPHDIFIAKGQVDVWIAFEYRRLTAPSQVSFPPGYKHSFIARTEATVLSIFEKALAEAPVGP